MEAIKDNSADDGVLSTQEQEIIVRLERYERGDSTIYTWEEMIFKSKSEKGETEKSQLLKDSNTGF